MWFSLDNRKHRELKQKVRLGKWLFLYKRETTKREAKMGVIIPKKHLRSAVKRNSIKRAARVFWRQSTANYSLLIISLLPIFPTEDKKDLKRYVHRIATKYI